MPEVVLVEKDAGVELPLAVLVEVAVVEMPALWVALGLVHMTGVVAHLHDLIPLEKAAAVLESTLVVLGGVPGEALEMTGLWIAAEY